MTLGQPYFDDLYRHHPDPWGFRTRWYETRKRQMTMAALPDRHYPSVFEPGCSIGLLTRLLAARATASWPWTSPPPPSNRPTPMFPTTSSCAKESVPATGRQAVSTSSCSPSWATTSTKRTASNWPAWPRPAPAISSPSTGATPSRTIPSPATTSITSSNRPPPITDLTRICSHVEPDFRLAVWSRDHRSVASRTGLLRT